MQYGCLIPPIYPTGVFIQSIEQTQTSTEAGGKNIITATLTNHTQQRFEILNGAKGDTGDAARIKEITASIDNGIGTPSVTVTSAGIEAEKTVHFDFKNLKGETGDVALTEDVKQHIDNRLAAIKMPLNPVCHYDMADVQYIDVTQNNLKNFSYTFREGNSYTNYSKTAIDASGNGNHATIVGDVEKATDNAIGAMIAFNKGFLTRPPQDFIGVGKQWSHSRWIKINSSEQDKTHNPRIWFYGAYDYSFFDIRENNGQIGNVALYCHRNSKTYLYCALSKESILDNKWHHLVVMTDLQPSYCRKIVYFDRQKIFDEKEMGDFSDWMDNRVHFDMGTGIDISSTKGHLANLIFFDRFLTEPEIQWLCLNPYYPAKRYSLAEYKADENRALLEELKKRIPTS